MSHVDLSDSFYADGDRAGTFQSGEIYHIARNRHGGSTATPIGRFFITEPEIGAEGYHPHKRLDCFVRDHSLSPSAEWLGRTLTAALLSTGNISGPVWTSWHLANEIGGSATGDVFDFD
jgi:hypothetical protein